MRDCPREKYGRILVKVITNMLFTAIFAAGPGTVMEAGTGKFYGNVHAFTTLPNSRATGTVVMKAFIGNVLDTGTGWKVAPSFGQVVRAIK